MKQCDILVCVWFATSKAGLDYYYNKICTWVSIHVAEQFKYQLKACLSLNEPERSRKKKT